VLEQRGNGVLGARRRPLERVVWNRLDEPSQPLGGGMEINR
jgi:hypothetical protein